MVTYRMVLNQAISMPPLTCSVAPVIYAAPGEAKNTTAAATSAASPRRASGICPISAVRWTSDRVRVIEIPSQFNVIADYPIGVLRRTTVPDAARAWVDLLMSPEGRAVLAEHGFIVE